MSEDDELGLVEIHETKRVHEECGPELELVDEVQEIFVREARPEQID